VSRTSTGAYVASELRGIARCIFAFESHGSWLANTDGRAIVECFLIDLPIERPAIRTAVYRSELPPLARLVPDLTRKIVQPSYLPGWFGSRRAACSSTSRQNSISDSRKPDSAPIRSE
jgi:hypothetical protein